MIGSVAAINYELQWCSGEGYGIVLMSLERKTSESKIQWQCNLVKMVKRNSNNLRRMPQSIMVANVFLFDAFHSQNNGRNTAKFGLPCV